MPTYNLVTDGGAVSGGAAATNDAAFAAFRVWAASNSPATLTIPAGTYDITDSAPFTGVTPLIVNATGATLRPTNAGFRMTSLAGFQQAPQVNARLNTVASGATTLVCRTAADASIFAANEYCALGALEFQGISGYPPNHHFFQYVRVVSVNGGTGEIVITPAASQSYSSAFPVTRNQGNIASMSWAGGTATVNTTAAHGLTSGNSAVISGVGFTGLDPNGVQVINVTDADTFTYPLASTFTVTVQGQWASAYDPGGPATLFKMVDSAGSLSVTTLNWAADVTFNGLTVHNNTGSPMQIYSPGLRVIFNSVTFTNVAPSPTVSKYQQFNSCSILDDQIEIDKECETIEFNNCSLKSMNIQSSSVASLLINNSTFTGSITGSTRNMTITGGSSIPSLQIGALYGATERVTIQNSTVSALSINTSVLHVSTDFTSATGTLTYTGSGVLSFPAPGTGIIVNESNRENIESKLVTNVTATGDTFFPIIHSGITSPVLSFTPPTNIWQHPCLHLNVSGSTGCDEIVELCDSTPQNKPIASYINRTKTFSLADGLFVADELIRIWGRLVSCRVVVSQAYTGVQSSVLLHVGNLFNNCRVLLGTTSTVWDAVVDCKTTGTRTITPTSMTGSAGADALGSAPGNIWFMNGIYPRLNVDISGEAAGVRPIVQIVFTTDQMLDDTTVGGYTGRMGVFVSTY